MRSFLKYVLASIVGLMLFFILGLVLVTVVISSSMSEVQIKNNSVLNLKLDKRIVERETSNLFAQLTKSFNGGEPGTIGLLELRIAIQNAAKDSKVKGVLLNVNGIDAGMATLEELRVELVRFKESGKFVVSYSDSYSELGYYLASVADKIYLPPSGMLEFNGLHTELLFFKNLLEKLEIQPEVFKVGQYKSAVEPFLNDKMSDANREQMKQLLNTIYGNMLEQIGHSRNISSDTLRLVSNGMLIRNPDDALLFNLITDIAYLDSAEAFMKEQIGLDSSEKLNYSDYWAFQEFETDGNIIGTEKIAVIYAVGDIKDGKGDEQTIGSSTIIEEIKKAREDSSIKAIVLRINSPGGSALASDIIWRELILTKEVKPLIASMGDVAASGGYYIAAACDSILAQPNTITGSIGVFGILFNGKDFINNKLYITTDREKTGPYADIGSFTRAVDKDERAIIQQEVEDVYKKFLEIVSTGRKLSEESVDSIAQGRVWSGISAKNNKLIDSEAGLEEAIELAAKMARLEVYKTVYLPERPNLYLKQLFRDTENSLRQSYMEYELGDLYPWVKAAQKVQQIKGVQTRLPVDIVIK
jgi:protease-4